MSIDFAPDGIMEKLLHYGVSYTNNEYMCVKIPKSASTWAKQYFHSLGWEDINFAITKSFDIPTLVFIREPKDRWIAGVSEFLERYYNNLYEEATQSTELRDSIFDSIFDKGLSMDSHTTPQTYFLRGLTNPIYFKVDDDLSEKVASFLGTIVDKERVNSKLSNPTWRVLATEYLDKNELATKTLDSYLETDYKLIKEVRFQ